MKYLFIGGPADGRRDALEHEHPSIYVHAPNETVFSMSETPNDYPRDYVYHRHRFSQSTVYLYSRLTPSEAVEILIRRYPQPL